MYLIAETLGVLRISEVEALPMRDLLEWAAWLKVKHEKPEQTVDQMKAIMRRAQAIG